MPALITLYSQRVVTRKSASTAIAVALIAFFAPVLHAQNQGAQPANLAFPDTAQLITQVAQDQKKVESIVSEYTFTDKTTDYMLDKNGNVHSQHTDVYYVTPTAYDFFSLHVSHDGKPVSQENLDGQMKKIEHQMKEDERKAQKNEAVHPKGQVLFAEIIANSDFAPVRWDHINGLRTVVYSFQPKSASRPRGSTFTDKIAADLRGKMWISPDEKEVVRIEFASVSSLNLGLMGSVKGFQGVTDQEKIHGEIWMPVRQEFVADGRELIKGFRMREVSEYGDYLKATTDVFQQVHSAATASAQPVSR
jgi:hypothetical protein